MDNNENKESNLEKLKNICNEYTPNPDLAKDVIKILLQQRKESESQTAEIKFKPKKAGVAAIVRNRGVIIAAACMCVLIIFLGIFLPLYLNRQNSNPFVYYDADAVKYEYETDINNFIKSENLNIKYYSDSTATSQRIVFVDSGKLAYIMQETIYIDDIAFDTLILGVQVVGNCKFKDFDKYENLENFTTISNVSIKYSVAMVDNLNEVKFTFDYDNAIYYMTVKTEGEPIERLTFHFNNLMAL